MEEKGKIGLFACLTIIIGGCIGSAIFSLAGMTIYTGGPAAILSWVVSGIILMFYGMQVAELAMRYPQSGGTFVFPMKAFGQKNENVGAFWGFISSWGYACCNIICVAFSAIYIAQYLGCAFGNSAFMTSQAGIIVLGVASCVLTAALCLLKLDDLGKFQDVIVILLVICMVVFICVACFGGTFNAANFTPFFTQGVGGKATGWISAIPIASVAYGACVGISFMVSEVKDPQKNIPKSLVIGLIVCIVLYALMMIATIGNIPTAFLVSDDGAGFRYIPIFGALWTQALGKYFWLSYIVAFAAVFALLTTMLAVTAISIRALQATAAGGYLPKWLASTNKNGVPLAATILVSGIAAVLSCFPDVTSFITSMGCLFSVLTIVITCASLLKSRKQFDLPADQYHAPLGNFLPWFTMLALLLCYLPDILGGGWFLWVFTIVLYGLGALVFLIYKNKRAKAA